MRELVEPDTQLPRELRNSFVNNTYQYTYLTSYYSHDVDLSDHRTDELLFVTHLATRVTFLADSGSAANLIRRDVAEHCYPGAWKRKTRKQSKITGVGGCIELEFELKISLGGEVVTFITGGGVPLNILGVSWTMSA